MPSPKLTYKTTPPDTPISFVARMMEEKEEKEEEQEEEQEEEEFEYTDTEITSPVISVTDDDSEHPFDATKPSPSCLAPENLPTRLDGMQLSQIEEDVAVAIELQMKDDQAATDKKRKSEEEDRLLALAISIMDPTLVSPPTKRVTRSNRKPVNYYSPCNKKTKNK
jgi:hypothetical protein